MDSFTGYSDSILNQPRYKENPALLLFEYYVLDRIKQLPAEKEHALTQLNLKAIFNTKSSEWREVICEQLRLSDTIGIAILDYWYQEKEKTPTPAKFAQSFADRFFADHGSIDIWKEGELEAAKKRIQEAGKQ